MYNYEEQARSTNRPDPIFQNSLNQAPTNVPGEASKSVAAPQWTVSCPVGIFPPNYRTDRPKNNQITSLIEDGQYQRTVRTNSTNQHNIIRPQPRTLAMDYQASCNPYSFYPSRTAQHYATAENISNIEKRPMQFSASDASYANSCQETLPTDGRMINYPRYSRVSPSTQQNAVPPQERLVSHPVTYREPQKKDMSHINCTTCQTSSCAHMQRQAACAYTPLTSLQQPTGAWPGNHPQPDMWSIRDESRQMMPMEGIDMTASNPYAMQYFERKKNEGKNIQILTDDSYKMQQAESHQIQKHQINKLKKLREQSGMSQHVRSMEWTQEDHGNSGVIQPYPLGRYPDPNQRGQISRTIPAHLSLPMHSTMPTDSYKLPENLNYINSSSHLHSRLTTAYPPTNQGQLTKGTPYFSHVHSNNYSTPVNSHLNMNPETGSNQNFPKPSYAVSVSSYPNPQLNSCNERYENINYGQTMQVVDNSGGNKGNIPFQQEVHQTYKQPAPNYFDPKTVGNINMQSTHMGYSNALFRNSMMESIQPSRHKTLSNYGMVPTSAANIPGSRLIQNVSMNYPIETPFVEMTLLDDCELVRKRQVPDELHVIPSPYQSKNGSEKTPGAEELRKYYENWDAEELDEAAEPNVAKPAETREPQVAVALDCSNVQQENAALPEKTNAEETEIEVYKLDLQSENNYTSVIKPLKERQKATTKPINPLRNIRKPIFAASESENLLAALQENSSVDDNCKELNEVCNLESISFLNDSVGFSAHEANAGGLVASVEPISNAESGSPLISETVLQQSLQEIAMDVKDSQQSVEFENSPGLKLSDEVFASSASIQESSIHDVQSQKVTLIASESKNLPSDANESVLQTALSPPQPQRHAVPLISSQKVSESQDLLSKIDSFQATDTNNLPANTDPTEISKLCSSSIIVTNAVQTEHFKITKKKVKTNRPTKKPSDSVIKYVSSEMQKKQVIYVQETNNPPLKAIDNSPLSAVDLSCKSVKPIEENSVQPLSPENNQRISQAIQLADSTTVDRLNYLLADRSEETTTVEKSTERHSEAPADDIALEPHSPSEPSYLKEHDIVSRVQERCGNFDTEQDQLNAQDPQIATKLDFDETKVMPKLQNLEIHAVTTSPLHKDVRSADDMTAVIVTALTKKAVSLTENIVDDILMAEIKAKDCSPEQEKQLSPENLPAYAEMGTKKKTALVPEDMVAEILMTRMEVEDREAKDEDMTADILIAKIEAETHSLVQKDELIPIGMTSPVITSVSSSHLNVQENALISETPIPENIPSVENNNVLEEVLENNEDGLGLTEELLDKETGADSFEDNEQPEILCEEEAFEAAASQNKEKMAELGVKNEMTFQDEKIIPDEEAFLEPQVTDDVLTDENSVEMEDEQDQENGVRICVGNEKLAIDANSSKFSLEDELQSGSNILKSRANCDELFTENNVKSPSKLECEKIESGCRSETITNFERDNSEEKKLLGMQKEETECLDPEEEKEFDSLCDNSMQKEDTKEKSNQGIQSQEQEITMEVHFGEKERNEERESDSPLEVQNEDSYKDCINEAELEEETIDSPNKPLHNESIEKLDERECEDTEDSCRNKDNVSEAVEKEDVQDEEIDMSEAVEKNDDDYLLTWDGLQEDELETLVDCNGEVEECEAIYLSDEIEDERPDSIALESQEANDSGAETISHAEDDSTATANNVEKLTSSQIDEASIFGEEDQVQQVDVENCEKNMESESQTENLPSDLQHCTEDYSHEESELMELSTPVAEFSPANDPEELIEERVVDTPTELNGHDSEGAFDSNDVVESSEDPGIVTTYSVSETDPKEACLESNDQSNSVNDDEKPTVSILKPKLLTSTLDTNADIRLDLSSFVSEYLPKKPTLGKHARGDDLNGNYVSKTTKSWSEWKKLRKNLDFEKSVAQVRLDPRLHRCTSPKETRDEQLKRELESHASQADNLSIGVKKLDVDRCANFFDSISAAFKNLDPLPLGEDLASEIMNDFEKHDEMEQHPKSERSNSCPDNEMPSLEISAVNSPVNSESLEMPCLEAMADPQVNAPSPDFHLQDPSLDSVTPSAGKCVAIDDLREPNGEAYGTDEPLQNWPYLEEEVFSETPRNQSPVIETTCSGQVYSPTPSYATDSDMPCTKDLTNVPFERDIYDKPLNVVVEPISPITQLKCSLSWDKIFNLSKTKKKNLRVIGIKNSGPKQKRSSMSDLPDFCKKMNGKKDKKHPSLQEREEEFDLELGPATIEVRLTPNGSRKQWNVVDGIHAEKIPETGIREENNNVADCTIQSRNVKSPIVVVQRIIMKRRAEDPSDAVPNDFNCPQGPSCLTTPPESDDNSPSQKALPKVVIKRTRHGHSKYQSFLRLSEGDVTSWQPVVQMERCQLIETMVKKQVFITKLPNGNINKENELVSTQTLEEIFHETTAVKSPLANQTDTKLLHVPKPKRKTTETNSYKNAKYRGRKHSKIAKSKDSSKSILRRMLCSMKSSTGNNGTVYDLVTPVLTDHQVEHVEETFKHSGRRHSDGSADCGQIPKRRERNSSAYELSMPTSRQDVEDSANVTQRAKCPRGRPRKDCKARSKPAEVPASDSDAANEGEQEPIVPETPIVPEPPIFTCQACKFVFEEEAEMIAHVQTHSYHCQKCNVAFISETDFESHLVAAHADTKQLHHCLLCKACFTSAAEHAAHTAGAAHSRLELTQRWTIQTLFALFTGAPCAQIAPLTDAEAAEMSSLAETVPGAINYYHEPTPLQLAVQDLLGRSGRSPDALRVTSVDSEKSGGNSTFKN